MRILICLVLATAVAACGDNINPNSCEADLECEDGDACTVDVCGEGGTCESSPLECDDGLFCNGGETCDSAMGCVAGTPPALDDGVGCTDDSCDEENDTIVSVANDANCNDDLFCNGVETCDATNDCQAGTPPTADDGVACTDEICDEDLDMVVSTPNDANCDDGVFCNGAETCDAVNDCQPPVPLVIDDGVACTDDSCDEDLDMVVNAPNNGLCDDGLFCNGAETCDTVNDCQPGAAPVIDDGVACTDDSCDEAADMVVNAPNNGNCDDSLFCNGAETCDAVNDCQPGAAPVIDDGVACTDDSCDEANDRVVNAPNNGFCSDGLFCNGAEICDVVNDCGPGIPPTVDDGVGCTVDTCDEDNDRVVNNPNDAVCNDFLFCNGVEFCDTVNDCQAGTAPVLDDGVGCTDDTCDEANDRVVNTPNDANCDDNLFCTGVETCDAIADCQAGTAPVVDDGVPCTDDSCDEANDRVVNNPNDANCTDGLFCNGAETCDAIANCQPGAPPVIDDGVACTDDSCDEANDRVVNAPNDALCDDGDTCTTADFCDAVNDCQNIPDVDPACGTCDNCSFETGDFTGWIASDIAGPFIPLGVYAGGTGNPFFFLASPTDGNFCAYHGFTSLLGPGNIEVGQNITIHPNAPTATLVFDYRLAWDLRFATNSRLFTVSVEPPGGGFPMQLDIIENPAPGTSSSGGTDIMGTVDLTPFVGQTVFIRFTWDVLPGSENLPGTAQIDNVAITL